MPPPTDVGSHVPPPDGVNPLHVDPGGPSDLSLLIGYTNHTGRHVLNIEVKFVRLITFLFSVENL